MITFYKSQKEKVVKIPIPKIIGSQVIGSIQYHHLSWDPDKPATILPASSFDIETVSLPASTEGRQCNTKKDKDRRKNRHTCKLISFIYLFLAQSATLYSILLSKFYILFSLRWDFCWLLALWNLPVVSFLAAAK